MKRLILLALVASLLAGCEANVPRTYELEISPTPTPQPVASGELQYTVKKIYKLADVVDSGPLSRIYYGLDTEERHLLRLQSTGDESMVLQSLDYRFGFHEDIGTITQMEWNGQPSPAPDGKRLIYRALSDEAVTVYLYDVATKERTQLYRYDGTSASGGMASSETNEFGDASIAVKQFASLAHPFFWSLNGRFVAFLAPTGSGMIFAYIYDCEQGNWHARANVTDAVYDFPSEFINGCIANDGNTFLYIANNYTDEYPYSLALQFAQGELSNAAHVEIDPYVDQIALIGGDRALYSVGGTLVMLHDLFGKAYNTLPFEGETQDVWTWAPTADGEMLLFVLTSDSKQRDLYIGKLEANMMDGPWQVLYKGLNASAKLLPAQSGTGVVVETTLNSDGDGTVHSAMVIEFE